MLFSAENIYRQYLLCRRNKRNAVSALAFEYRQEEQLLDLRNELTSRAYAPGRSVCFFTQRPKLREIFAADFRDRIVHHILVDYLERIWEPLFIHDSYACRRDKGVHRAVARLQQFIRRVTANGVRPAWYLQLDIKSYFVSIDHEILYQLIADRLPAGADEVRRLARTLIFHDCAADPIVHGDPGLLTKIPPHKSLFFAPPGKGLPIGNLTSQFFANVYLTCLDQFVKHTLKCRHYLRYCDDFVLLADNREDLLRWEEQIAAFLQRELSLELNAKRRRLLPVGNGVDFLGYIVRREYLLVRRRVVGNLRRKLDRYEGYLVQPMEAGRVRFRYDRNVLDALAATLSSYLGHCKLAASYRLVRSLWRRYPFLSEYFAFDSRRWRLIRRYDLPATFSSVRRQYVYFRRRFPGDVILFQVGCYCEFYRRDDAKTAALLGLAPLGPNRRGARWGFPLRLLHDYLGRLRAAGRAVTLVMEGARWGAVKERRQVWRETNAVLKPDSSSEAPRE